MGKLADALRINREGKFLLPYQERWRPGSWSDYADRIDKVGSLDDQDKRILDIGFEIGSRCQQVWAEIRLQEQHAPLPAMCAALITQVNLLYAESKISKRAYSVTAHPHLPEEIEEKAVNTQMFVDVISDYVFSRMNAVPGLSTVLDLSPLLGNDAIHSYADDLRGLLIIIAAFRFVFDQLLFLNAPVTVEEGRIMCRIAKGGFSEFYFAQSKISELVEGLLMKSKVSKPPTSLPREYLDYKLVRNVHVTSGELSVDVNHASFEAKKSALFLMRSSIETEYLWTPLSTFGSSAG